MKNISVKGFQSGKQIDIQLSQLVMGSGDFLRIDNSEEAFTILDRFVASGGTTFDTARHYRYSEEAIGAWMKERNNREEVVIFTKCAHPVREFPDTPRVTPEAIKMDLNKSLEMLGTTYVDLFALHRDDVTQPVGPIMEELNKCIKEGKVRAIGTSNWETNRIIEANQYAKKHNLVPFTFNSPNLSLARTKIPRWPGCVSADEKMIEYHKQTNLPLISWSSQAGGFFSGAYKRNDFSNKEMVEVYYNVENWDKYDRALELAVKKGVTPIQIALAYVLNQPFPTAAAVGCEKMSEFESSLIGSELILSAQEVNYLEFGY